MKLKRTIPREFLDYWWLFQMQHILHYGARLAEEENERKKERKMKMNNSYCNHFSFATLKLLLCSAKTGSGFISCSIVLLDVSICSPVMCHNGLICPLPTLMSQQKKRIFTSRHHIAQGTLCIDRQIFKFLLPVSCHCLDDQSHS